jgi:hypothetical protein
VGKSTRKAPEVVGRSSLVEGGNATHPKDIGMESRLVGGSTERVGRAGRGDDGGGECVCEPSS